MRAILILCLITIFISCGNKNDKPILPPQKMEAVLLDFVMAEAHTNTRVHIDSVILAQKENVKLQKRIFAIHGITREDFQQSFDYYTNHSAEFTPILDSIVAKEGRRTAPLIIEKYE